MRRLARLRDADLWLNVKFWGWRLDRAKAATARARRILRTNEVNARCRQENLMHRSATRPGRSSNDGVNP